MSGNTFSTLLLAVVFILGNEASQAFGAPQTMRLDYYHTGNSSNPLRAQ